MKNLSLLIFFILFCTGIARADSIWIEANAKGQVGKAQTIKVIFGSYNEYRLQKVTTDDFQQVKDFTCWAISPSGKHISLAFKPKVIDYQATFIPQEQGTYVLLVENKLRRVEDWSNSSTKIGIAKQHYYGRTTLQVGNDKSMATNALSDLTIVKDENSDTAAYLTVLLHGKPVPNAAVTIRHPEMPEQKLTTDAKGKVSFKAPKPGRYFGLVTLKFETPGTFKGVHYDVFREKATVTMIL
jgi:uncharacterized GH25 family protein